MSTFALLCEAVGLPRPVPEYRFHPTRMWRWDWAFVPQKVAVEVDGGLHIGGRHNRGAGRERDLEKHNEGVAMGWRVLVVSPRMLDDCRALGWLERLLKEDR
jgi:very-short-patch-repair endonuclease